MDQKNIICFIETLFFLCPFWPSFRVKKDNIIFLAAKCFVLPFFAFALLILLSSMHSAHPSVEVERK